jgi:rSAM/selenodomain-associated transferase 1
VIVHLAILLKAPRAGFVKTRLAAEIGEQHALRLYRLMAGRALAALKASGHPATIWYTPVEAQPEIRRWVGTEWDLRAQASGDLGVRLSVAARAVQLGSLWICVGGDCPEFSEGHLHLAIEALQRHSVVLGPTVDGGYYLVGGRVPLPDIFSGMPWSTDRLLEATRRRLGDAGVPWSELPVLRDVDTAADARASGLLT